MPNNSEFPQIQDKVLILHPPHIAGKIGVICGQEELANEQPSGRWLVQIDPENIVVSLARNEFEKISK